MVLKDGCEEAQLEECSLLVGLPLSGDVGEGRAGGREGGEEGLCGRLQGKIRGIRVYSGEQGKGSELCGINQLPHQAFTKMSISHQCPRRSMNFTIDRTERKR